MPYWKTYDQNGEKSFGSWDIRAASVEWEVDAMSDGEICARSSCSNSSMDHKDCYGRNKQSNGGCGVVFKGSKGVFFHFRCFIQPTYFCGCSNNEEAESYCQCESENETPDIGDKKLGKYYNSNEHLDNYGEEIITAAFDLDLATSDSEDSIKKSGSDNGQADSVTNVTDNTSPSQLTILTPDYDKPCFSSYFTPEKYTRTKVRTFRKTGDRTFKMEASSAINRRKKQFEIDRQNMIILKKLREVKPVVVLPK